MCDRFTLVTEPEKLMKRFLLDELLFELQSRYNFDPRGDGAGDRLRRRKST